MVVVIRVVVKVLESIVMVVVCDADGGAMVVTVMLIFVVVGWRRWLA